MLSNVSILLLAALHALIQVSIQRTVLDLVVLSLAPAARHTPGLLLGGLVAEGALQGYCWGPQRPQGRCPPPVMVAHLHKLALVGTPAGEQRSIQAIY